MSSKDKKTHQVFQGTLDLIVLATIPASTGMSGAIDIHEGGEARFYAITVAGQKACAPRRSIGDGRLN
jgi:hypothetical protein